MKNKKIIIFAFLISLLIFMPTVFAGDLNFKICFTYNRNNSFSIKNLEVYVGKISPEFEPPTSKYILKIFDSSNNILFTKKLAISFFNPITNKVQEKNEGCYEIPYDEKASKLKIFYDNKEIFSSDLKNHICNKNSICNLGENQYNCPEDCKEKVEGSPIYLYVLIIASVALVILIFNYLRMKNKSISFNSLKQKWS